jgi:hypothetical protein
VSESKHPNANSTDASQKKQNQETNSKADRTESAPQKNTQETTSSDESHVGSDDDGSSSQDRDSKKESRKETIGFRSFAKNIIFGENESVEKENNSSLFGTVLETGDKAKSEMVRMFGREVRNYLNALEIGKDVHNLLTNYSLEVSASIHLKPLTKKTKDSDSKDNSKDKK